jgi:signal transduction histidine kinase
MQDNGIIVLDTLGTDGSNNLVFIRKVNDTADSLFVYVNHQIKKIKTKKADLEKAFEKMVVEVVTEERPVEEKLSKDLISKELSEELTNNGITLPFEFAVVRENRGTVELPIRSDGFREEDWSGSYKVDLFPDEPFGTPHFVTIYFPGQQIELLRSISWLLASSILLTLLILFTFFLTISFIFRQKRISDIKSDFINNITHEFKTPIATISLAADSIAKVDCVH